MSDVRVINLADPEFEPTDEELQELSNRAFADLFERHEAIKEKIRMSIESLKQKEAERVILYADDRTELGQEALRMLVAAGQLPTEIPVAGGIPFVVRGRSRYVGIDEIAGFLRSLNV